MTRFFLTSEEGAVSQCAYGDWVMGIGDSRKFFCLVKTKRYWILRDHECFDKNNMVIRMSQENFVCFHIGGKSDLRHHDPYSPTSLKFHYTLNYI